MNDKTQQWHDKDMETWEQAEDDVGTALNCAEEILERNNYLGQRSKIDSSIRVNMIVDVAGLIMEQRRHYKDHAV